MGLTIKRIGLTKVHPPEADDNATVDIVFVHGLFGHPYNTWTAKPSQSPTGVTIIDDAPVQTVEGANQPGDAANVRAVRSTIRRLFSSHRARKPAPEAPDLSASAQNLHVTASLDEHSKDQIIEEEATTKDVQLELTAEPTRKIFWPRDLLPQIFENANIFTWGYDATVLNLATTAGQLTIFQHARTLVSDLCDARPLPGDQARPIIFVAHSLEVTHFNEIFPATKGVCFLGTPHRGSDTASIGKLAFEISKAFFQKPNLPLLRSLEVNSENLERISHHFSIILAERKLTVHSFMEELRTKGVMVVPAFSYSIGDAFETKSAIHATHSGMTKFTSLDDEGFVRVSNTIARLVRTARYSNKMFLALKFETSKHNSSYVTKSSEVYNSNRREQSCLDNLDQLEARTRIEEVSKSFGNTLEWVFESKVTYREWLRSKESGIYWIQGKPASGKSTLMKHALKHPTTRKLLMRCDGREWIVGGFFFHDRGSAIQKSVNGLLSEMLYSILSATPARNLVRKILPLWGRVEARARTGNVSSLKPSWYAEELFEALTIIFEQGQTSVRVCFFIDALDEHIGDHRSLVQSLKRLFSIAGDHGHLLKLCLASRPENVFKTELLTFPGLSIQDHTAGDIRHYVFEQLKNEFAVRSDPERLRHLANSVVEKAQGVFLWVELVMEELLEGLIEADRIEELEELLVELPEDLDQLYRRAIKRVVPLAGTTSGKARTKKRCMETMTMFQMALCARSPYYLTTFVNACSIVVSGQLYSEGSSEISYAPESWEDMKRKLSARSAGLLETVAKEIYRNDKIARVYLVQFIHQTAKEFVQRGYLQSALSQEMNAISVETGHVLTLRYCVRVLVSGFEFNISHFLYHAERAEIETRQSQFKELSPLFSDPKTAARNIHRMLTQLPVRRYTAVICPMIEEPLINLAIILISAGMPLTTADILPILECSSWHEGALLVATLSKDLIGNLYLENETTFRLLELLLKHGLDANAPCRLLENDRQEESYTTVLIELVELEVEYRGERREWWRKRVQLLLQYGADPEKGVSGRLSPRKVAEFKDDRWLLQQFGWPCPCPSPPKAESNLTPRSRPVPKAS